MNEQVKELLSRLKRYNEERYLVEIDCRCSKLLLDYITSLQEENERLNTELNSYKDEFCKDTIKEYELVMEQEYYKSRCKEAIEYIKTRADSSKAIKYELLNILNGCDEEN